MERKRDAKIQLRPDAWERFEAAVDHAVKTPAMHREAKKARPASKGERVRKAERRN